MISVERFEGVDAFIKAINNRPVNSVFKGQTCSSQRTKDKSFFGTETYDESISIMQSGYKEGLEMMNNSKGRKITAGSTASKNLPKAGIVGFAPHVPNAIAGIPFSMISTQRQTQKSKVINILYDCTESAFVKIDDFVKAGRNLLDLIVSLEGQGYRVSLDIMLCSCNRKHKQGFMMSVKVKDHRQPINPLKVAYALIHPSFFRRQGFRWLETSPVVTLANIADGYGCPMRYLTKDETTASCRELLKGEGLLDKETFFTNVDEAKKVTDINDLAEKMGMKLKK